MIELDCTIIALNNLKWRTPNIHQKKRKEKREKTEYIIEKQEKTEKNNNNNVFLLR